MLRTMFTRATPVAAFTALCAGLMMMLAPASNAAVASHADTGKVSAPAFNNRPFGCGLTTLAEKSDLSGVPVRKLQILQSPDATGHGYDCSFTAFNSYGAGGTVVLFDRVGWMKYIALQHTRGVYRLYGICGAYYFQHTGFNVVFYLHDRYLLVQGINRKVTVAVAKAIFRRNR
jgi:hypothetical protein